jgi:integrase
MTEGNQSRLRPFDDPVNVQRLLDLPQHIARTIGHAEEPGYFDAVTMQSALLIALELVAPLRAKNLANITLDRHIVRSRPGPGAVVHLVVPGVDVKNKVDLEFPLPPDVVRLLDLYIARFRPLLAKNPSNFLFPARKGGAKDPGPLGTQVKKAIRKALGLTLNLHAFRHLCAFLFLKAHPGEYETVRLLLGHKNIATTIAFYCGLERAAAVQRLDKMLDSYRRPDERHHAQ